MHLISASLVIEVKLNFIQHQFYILLVNGKNFLENKCNCILINLLKQMFLLSIDSKLFISLLFQNTTRPNALFSEDKL